jgi:phage N-6-adenine-methyltransferase
VSPALRLLDADPPPYYARHNTSNEWATPAPLFAALNREFGFTLDVCASELNHRCARYFTSEQDGLTQEWTGVCWMNPPYGREIGAWIRKAVASAEAGATVVCLIPSRTDTSWWHDEIIRSGAEVRFLRGRIRFNSGKGRAPFPSAVVIFRPELFPTTPPAAADDKPAVVPTRGTEKAR